MSKAKFFALAEKSGMSVEYEPDADFWIQIWSPTGKVFASSGCHVDASFQGMKTDTGRAPDWKICINALSDVIASGFHDCPDGDSCDTCHPDDVE